MKLVFLSNYFNHHQSALSDALWKETEGQYLFVEGKQMPPERAALGCGVAARDYVLSLMGRETQVLQAVREADVVIAGSAPEWLVRERIRTGRLLLRYGERPLKHGSELWKYLPRLLRWHWRNPKGKPIYLLCASAYAAGDYARFGLFREKTYRWGYFPETKVQEPAALMGNKNPKRILWCGRFVPEKHPEAAVLAVKRAWEKGFGCQLDFVGAGPQERQLRELVKKLGLEGCVGFLGLLPPEGVRQAMEGAGIFLFTSDAQEGWGAVLNEAMNSGCAVIASHAAGAVPFLIRHGENGEVYPFGNVERLSLALCDLLSHPEEQRRLGMGAYETILGLWNAEAAARRLLTLSRALLEDGGGRSPFAEGPCSPAQIIDEDWFQ